MKKTAAIILPLILAALIFTAYYSGIIPRRSYTNADFGIEPYTSPTDADGDGIDDQTDILQSAKEYIATDPEYKSEYYGGGYPDDGYGVCTDVIAFALKGAGYDLMELVSEDISAKPYAYDIETPDKNIDFRRVRNLLVYFQNNAQPLTTDLSQIGEWQGGDIVIFPEHIGIISDRRNSGGLPFLIHHAYPGQLHLEEDVLEQWEITAHFRMPKN